MSDAGITTPPANGAVTPPPAAAATPAPWYQAEGFSDDDRAAAINRGYDKLDTAAAAREAVKALRETQRLLRAPADQILVLPKNADDPAWAQIHQRLGAPADPSGYTFDEVKKADGSPAPPEHIEMVRAVASELNLPVAAAAKLAARLLAAQEKGAADATSARALAAAAEKATLMREWGPQADLHLFLAQKGAQRFGIDAEAMAAIEAGAGYAKTIKFFREIGGAMSEPELLRGGPATIGAPQTPEAAQASLNEKMQDRAWYARWKAGDPEAVKEFRQLNSLAVGQTPGR